MGSARSFPWPLLGHSSPLGEKTMSYELEGGARSIPVIREGATSIATRRSTESRKLFMVRAFVPWVAERRLPYRRHHYPPRPRREGTLNRATRARSAFGRIFRLVLVFSSVLLTAPALGLAAAAPSDPGPSVRNIRLAPGSDRIVATYDLSSDAPASPAAIPTYAVVRLTGVLGRQQTAGAFLSQLDAAAALNPSVLVVEIQSRGGLYTVLESILDRIEELRQSPEPPRLVGLVRQRALHAAAFLAATLDNNYLLPSAELGGTADADAWDSDELDDDVRIYPMVRHKAVVAAEKAGRNPLLVKAYAGCKRDLYVCGGDQAMFTEKPWKTDLECRLLVGAGGSLRMDAEDALAFGLADGIVGDFDALGQALGYDRWVALRVEEPVPNDKTAQAVDADDPDQFQIHTIDFEVVDEERGGPVSLKWRGEVTNSTVEPAKLIPVVWILDSKGVAIQKFELSPVEVFGLKSVKVSGEFKVAADIWKSVDAIEEIVKADNTYSKEIKETQKHGKVELYVMNNCSYCFDAVRFLDDNYIYFEEFNISTDPYAERKFRKKYKARTMPLLVVNGEIKVRGFFKEQFEEIFGIKNEYDEDW